MFKLKFAIVEIGNIHFLSDLKALKAWNSELFEINNFHCIENLPQSNVEDGYLDVKYHKDELQAVISCPSDSDIAIGIMPYRFVDNFYMHRLSPNIAIISLYGIKDILDSDNISIEHFIIKQLYEICTIRHILPDISDNSVYDLVHLDTRGCLFDMNGNRVHILYNTENPIICDECKAKLKSRQIESNVINKLEKELKRIRKPLILRVERKIKKYPFVSLISSFTVAIIVSILSNLLCDLLIDNLIK